MIWLSVAATIWTGVAAAYPFTISHGYTSCVSCHVDPSGGGALTPYGRGQAEIFMRSVYRKRPSDWEPKGNAEFAFGVPLPKEVTVQADARAMLIPQPGNVRVILMQGDLRGQVQTGKFRAYGSVGVASEGGYAARITSNPDGWNLLSREHWLGYELTRGLLVRAGRMALPFGIRTDEHILYARAVTRTDGNDDQQLGVDVVYGQKKLRAELMGIAGNYQVSPDEYRERGYSATASYAVDKNLEVGVSSLVTHAELDIALLDTRLRQAHGVFARYSPVERIGVFAEGNVLADAVGEGDLTVGSVGYLQVDTEPAQGLHVRAGGEWCDDNHGDDASAVLRATGSVIWFFLPHLDVRADVFYGTLYCTPGTEPGPLALVQLHGYL